MSSEDMTRAEMAIFSSKTHWEICHSMLKDGNAYAKGPADLEKLMEAANLILADLNNYRQIIQLRLDLHKHDAATVAKAAKETRRIEPPQIVEGPKVKTNYDPLKKEHILPDGRRISDLDLHATPAPTAQEAHL